MSASNNKNTDMSCDDKQRRTRRDSKGGVSLLFFLRSRTTVKTFNVLVDDTKTFRCQHKNIFSLHNSLECRFAFVLLDEKKFPH